MDRLLSEQEMLGILSFVSFNDFGKEQLGELRSAQLAKADKEWVWWISNISYCCVNNKCEHDYACTGLPFVASCEKWQERKRSIGL